MPVDVLLKTKIHKLGAEADMVTVKPGYARNYLLPQGLAVIANSATKKQIEQLRKKRAEREAEELNKAQHLAGKINKLKLSFVLAAGLGQEKVFGSVTSQMIVDKLKEEGFEIDRKQVKLDKPIKETGEVEVSLDLHSEVQSKVKLVISVPVPENAPVEDKADFKGKKGTKTFKKSEKS
jgi:large subunit ribosomal protein L9